MGGQGSDGENEERLGSNEHHQQKKLEYPGHIVKNESKYHLFSKRKFMTENHQEEGEYLGLKI